MTNVVRKGANRAGHTARTAKAAQRTPLPPRGAQRGVTKAVSAEIIRDAVDEAAAQAQAGASKTARKPRAAKPAPAKAVETAQPKVAAYVAVVEQSDWDCKISKEGDRTSVLASKNGEQLWVHFDLGNWSVTADQVFIRVDGSRVRIRNASAAKKQLLLPPESRPVAPRVRPTERAAREVEDDTPQRSLPFDPETVSDVELMEMLKVGVRLTWRSTLSGVQDSDVVQPEHRYTRVEHNKVAPSMRSRAIGFIGGDGQFRSVSLRSLLRFETLSPDEGRKVAEDFTAAKHEASAVTRTARKASK